MFIQGVVLNNIYLRHGCCQFLNRDKSLLFRCYPFTDEDPFCFPGNPLEAPHVIFSAGHATFESRRWDGCGWRVQTETPSSPNGQESISVSSPILIAIPKFFGFKQLVLVDLDTLSCRVKEFWAFASGIQINSKKTPIYIFAYVFSSIFSLFYHPVGRSD